MTKTNQDYKKWIGSSIILSVLLLFVYALLCFQIQKNNERIDYLEIKLIQVGNEALYEERVSLQQQREIECLQEIAAKNNVEKASIKHWGYFDKVWYEEPIAIRDTSANSTHWIKVSLNNNINVTSSWPPRSLSNERYWDFGTFWKQTPVEFTRTEKESCAQPLPGYEEVLQ